MVTVANVSPRHLPQPVVRPPALAVPVVSTVLVMMHLLPPVQPGTRAAVPGGAA